MNPPRPFLHDSPFAWRSSFPRVVGVFHLCFRANERCMLCLVCWFISCERVSHRQDSLFVLVVLLCRIEERNLLPGTFRFLIVLSIFSPQGCVLCWSVCRSFVSFVFCGASCLPASLPLPPECSADHLVACPTAAAFASADHRSSRRRTSGVQ